MKANQSSMRNNQCTVYSTYCSGKWASFDVSEQKSEQKNQTQLIKYIDNITEGKCDMPKNK